MTLYINTTEDHKITVDIRKGDKLIVSKKINAPYKQAEKLLPLIDEIIKKAKIKLADLTKIEVANRGGSFTALRIGVATANALGFALGIPVYEAEGKGKKLRKFSFSVVKPIYDKEPNINLKKHITHNT